MTAAPLDLAAVFAQAQADVTSMFGRIDIAEDEIAKAAKDHPAAARLYHAFTLMRPTSEMMATEFVYRSHCAELAGRVAAGLDTRPGTAAEVCLGLCHTSLQAPLTSTGAGLYFRMWAKAFPDKPAMSGQAVHYEAIGGAQIDAAEEEARRLSRADWRVPGKPECAGRHHGVEVACEFHDTSTLF